MFRISLDSMETVSVHRNVDKIKLLLSRTMTELNSDKSNEEQDNCREESSLKVRKISKT